VSTTRLASTLAAGVLSCVITVAGCSKSPDTQTWWCLSRGTTSACFPWERQFCEGIRTKLLEKATKGDVSECTAQKKAWCAMVCTEEKDCAYQCSSTLEGCQRDHREDCVSRAVPDHPEIPVGTGWHCWATPLEGKVASFCSRYLPLCEANLRSTAELIRQDGHNPPSECHTNTQAWCYSITQGGHSTGWCVERPFDCNALRDVARKSASGNQDFVFSDCWLQN
jgi:hypothetical protein